MYDRLIRFVSDGSIGDLACAFDAEKNILRIDQYVYNAASDREKKELLRSKVSLIRRKVAA